MAATQATQLQKRLRIRSVDALRGAVMIVMALVPTRGVDRRRHRDVSALPVVRAHQRAVEGPVVALSVAAAPRTGTAATDNL